MDNITVGQIMSSAIRLATFIGAVGVIYGAVIKWLNKVLEEKFDTIDKKVVASIDKLNDKLDAVDYNGCKNFLVSVISDIDNGRDVSETTIERFYENYDHYANECDGNGYIKAKVEALERSGKLARFL